MEILFKAIFTFLFGIIIWKDFRWGIIPNHVLLILLPFILGTGIIWTDSIPLSLVYGGCSSFLMFLVLWGFWRKGKMGGGDVKLISLLPLLFNPTISLFQPNALIWVIIVTTILSIPVNFYIRRNKNEQFPNHAFPLGVPLGLASILFVWW